MEPIVRSPAKVTEKRKAEFLRVLRATGSPAAAARAATPWSSRRRGGYSTFRDLRKRDVAFARAWDEAMAEMIGSVEAEVVKRAMNPVMRPVYSKGELVDHVAEYDNKLLLRLAEKLNPADWIPNQRVQHSGAVTHQHGHLVLAMEDLMLLEEEQQDALVGLLQMIAERRPGHEPEAVHLIGQAPEGIGQ